MDELSKLRQDIDSIDRELVYLFEKRMNRVKEIGKYKRRSNLQVLDASREEQVIKKNIGYLEDSSLEKELVRFFKGLMDISKEVQGREQREGIRDRKGTLTP